MENPGGDGEHISGERVGLDEEFATATMATLFELQGMPSKALSVYARLLKRDPANRAHFMKVRELSNTIRSHYVRRGSRRQTTCI